MKNKVLIEDMYPLSPLQEGMLFHSLYAPETSHYFEQMTCTLFGDLDREAFQRAWQRVVERHAVLRTSFVWQSRDEPFQVVHRQVDLPWHEEDWRDLPGSEQEAKILDFMRDDRQRDFQLNRPPLVRIRLIRLADSSYRFIWSYHHLLLDGWCISLLVNELFSFYEAFRRGEDLRQPKPRPYRDYISWLRNQDLSELEDYWRRELSGITAATPLGMERPADGHVRAEDAYREQAVRLSAELTEALRELARRHQLTLNVILNGAWSLLLSRYSGERSVVFGAVVSGRPPALERVETMVGLFINSLPIRVDVPAEEPLVFWLQGLRDRQLRLQQIEYSPLAKVHAWSSIPASQPLFETLLAFANYPVDPSLGERGSLRIEEVDVIERTNYPLVLMSEPGREWPIEVGYDRCRFEDGAITRLLGHLQTILGSFAASPELGLSEHSLLSRAERQQLLMEWIDTSSEAGALSIVERFERQVLRAPDRPAVLFEGEQLTYDELNRRANRLAHHLRRLGAGPDSCVGLLLDRSVDLAVGVFGILKSGAAYVPLDPEIPSERIAYQLADARVAWVVTQTRQAASLSGSEGVVVLEDEARWSKVGEDRNPLALADPENLAYVIYTSGSTGSPKGVMIPRSAVANYAAALHRFIYPEDDRPRQVSLNARIAFDASIKQLLHLLWGCSVHVLPDRVRYDAAEMVAYVRRHHLDVLDCAPSQLRLLLEAELLEQVHVPGVILVGGEALDHSLWQTLRRSRRSSSFNHYGPTECTVNTTICRIEAERPILGRPLANMRVYLLGPDGQPVPSGLPGEIYIGGRGLARGYAGRPDLTAEQFVPDPFGERPGERLYRTGDLARLLLEGQLEFIGRVDHQVKVRGFRIELGEIETSLRQSGVLKEVVVLAREDSPGSRRLVAYIVPTQGYVSTSELRSFLQRRVPDYMIPAAFVVLERLPLTPNGKVDRRRLPAPEQARPDLAQPFTAPETRLEELLAGIWADVLRLDRVGVYDDFFELGGDSILSLQIVSRAHRAGLKVSPRQIFESPTVAELAAVVAWAPASKPEQEAVTGQVPLTPIQRSFFELGVPRADHWNMPLLLELRRWLDPVALNKVFAALLVHHDALRLRFCREGSGWMQTCATPEGSVPFTFVDFSQIEPDRQKPALSALGESLQASLCLATGPLLRVALCDFGESRSQRLLIVMHHLVIDGVSWRILLEDLAAGYEQVLQGEPLKLPSKTTSFKQWAQRLAEHTLSGALDHEEGYWLADSRRNVSALPVDLAAGANDESSARTVTVKLSREETHDLLQRVPPAYRSQINDALLAALNRALAPWASGGGLLVDVEGHGREDLFPDLDLTRTVGWFTSVFPLRLQPTAELDPGSTLKAAKEQLRSVPGRGLGYGLLRYLSRNAERTRRFSEMPQADILFNYLGQLDGQGSEAAFVLPADEPIGFSQDPRAPRSHKLELNCAVIEGRLQATFTYSENLHRRETIESLAREFVAQLRGLTDHCLKPGVGGYTPSEFPLARLDQARLDLLLGTERTIEDVYPLSPLQQGILFQSLREPDRGMYVGQFSYDLHGEVDAAVLRQAWQQVLDRHAALRTAFSWQELDEPLQIVRKRLELPWEEQDWSALASDALDARWDALMHFDRQRGFVLSRPPLMRLLLVRTGSANWRLLWTRHHLIVDGWSMPLILQEVLTLYKGCVDGKPVRLEPARPYSRYIQWLRNRDLAAAEDFWRGHLGAFSEPTPLPHDGSVEERGSEDGRGTRTLRLAKVLTASLRSLSREHQLTLNTVVQGAWALVLGRCSAKPVIVYGVVVSGRPPDLEGVEGMVGLFINTLPLSVSIDNEEKVVSWLQTVQLRQVEMGRHEHSPLLRVQEWSAVPAGVSLFESLVVFENYPTEDLQGDFDPGFRLAGVRQSLEESTPMVLTVEPESEMALHIGFDVRRFDPVAMERVLGWLGNCLQGFVDSWEQPVDRVSLLSTAEQHQLLVEAHGRGFAARRAGLSVHRWFEEQVRRSPCEVALEWLGGSLTYQELNDRSNRLAHCLSYMEVGLDVPVALLAERSPETLVGILAILKAGGAYLPLDPAFPDDRLAFMAEDAGARALLVQARFVDRLPAVQVSRLLLDDDSSSAGFPAHDLPVETQGASLAYILYTSGSTGRPKGVMVPHSGLTNYLEWCIASYGADQGQGAPLYSPLGFDLTVTSLFLPLLAGKTVFVLAEGRGEELIGSALRADDDLSFVKLTPAHLEILVREANGNALAAPHLLIVGGEALSAETAAAWRSRAPATRLINEYGPTEAVVGCCVYELNGSEPDRGQVPIGRAISNVQLYVVDPGGRLVPARVAGELCIGGISLARGYLNRPELTAERFIPNRFSAQPGSRLYRTGDLARYGSDGNLEFLGRIDQQIKLRGFRIEPGEIESVLREHPKVAEAVVVARAEQSESSRLVAYIVPAPSSPVTDVGLTAMREWLQSRLPTYMVPDVIVTIESLPLTVNGKIDLRALPSPERLSQSDYVAPRNAIEAQVAAMCAEILGIEKVSVQQSFSELGGHSLQTLTLIARIRRSMGVVLPLPIVLGAPTVEGISRSIAEHQAASLDAQRLEQLLAEVESLTDGEAQPLNQESE
ncbi:MAG TPA: amino acid adenylation domain-containing protein [Thermoanaerobaculia bacterium]|nr:amino acid adenylation domain-containing protein [Thermoanaerobaculia bacterium]